MQPLYDVVNIKDNEHAYTVMWWTHTQLLW